LTGKQLLAYRQGIVDDDLLFKALADPTRRAVVGALAERGGQTLFEICSRLALQHGVASTRQAISQHLDVLADAGLVRSRREGRYKFHDLDPAPLRAMAHRLLEQLPEETQ
jgi:DNA-binding transcriptional ArsR family regulator